MPAETKGSWPVSRVLYNRSCDNHSSRMHITIHLKQPTQKQRGPRLSFSIWSCSRWGLPCHNCYQLCGALLPHHFTLTPITETVKPRRYLSAALAVGFYTPQVLPGTLPYGARTFLSATTHRECLHSDCPANF